MITLPKHTHAHFATTHWSVVLAAGNKTNNRRANALQTLCQTYWYPLYAYLRHKGDSHQDAEDLIQSFFVFLLEKDRLGSLVRDKGKFRSFLLTTLNHFRLDQWKREQSIKRGNGRSPLSLDMRDAESRFVQEPIDTTTPEKLFDLNWAVTLLNTVFEELQQEYQDKGQGDLFEALKFCLTGQRSALPYTQLAVRLGISEANIKVTIHRLRNRYRELLRQQVAHTVATPEEVEEELRSLFQVLA